MPSLTRTIPSAALTGAGYAAASWPPKTGNRVRIRQIATNYGYDAADIDCVLGGLEIAELKPLLLSRVSAFTRPEKEQVLSRHHRPELVGEAIELFANARNYRSAESVERNVLRPFSSLFQAEDVRRIMKAAEDNDQIHNAGGTSNFMVDLFERTEDLHDDTRPAWQSFVSKMQVGKDPENGYAYPQLRKKLEAEGMWPPPPATPAPAAPPAAPAGS
jgi:hypothetical protein